MNEADRRLHSFLQTLHDFRGPQGKDLRGTLDDLTAHAHAYAAEVRAQEAKAAEAAPPVGAYLHILDD